MKLNVKKTLIPAKVQEVRVAPGRLEVDPVTITSEDIVAWNFSQQACPYSMQQVQTFDDILSAHMVPPDQIPK